MPMIEKNSPSYLWHTLLSEGGIIVVSTYEKYNGGLSPRDVLALTRVLAHLSRHGPRYPIVVRSFLSLQPEDWDDHLILIGGLLSNQVTRALTQDHLRGLQSTLDLKPGMLRDTTRPPGRDCLTPTYNFELEGSVAGVETDYGIVAVQPNPMDLSKRLYMLAGIKGWGTLAAATVFAYKEHRKMLNHLFEQHFDMTLEETKRCSQVEIIVRTEVGSTGAQGVKSLKSVSVELVRVNGDVNTEWINPGSQLHWGPKPPAASLHQPTSPPSYLSLGLNERVAVVELRGSAFAARLDESCLTPRKLDQLEYETASAVRRRDWRVGAKIVGQHLLYVLPSGFRELMQQMQTIGVRPERSRIRFVTPREYLRAPFELLRTQRDYLVLEYPVFRAISNAFSVRRGLSPSFIEDLKIHRAPLHVLLVASDPTGTILEDVSQEIETIIQICSSMQHVLGIQIDINAIWPQDATLTRIQRALQGCPYHIFHFAGHSKWDADNPEQSALLLKDTAGREVALPAAQLSMWLRNSELRFCFLSSCEGTKSDGERQLLHRDFLGLADALVQAGIPEVLGFRWPVSSKGALRLAQGFYQALFSDAQFNSERATFLVRCRMAERGRDDLTWLSPILIAQK